MISNAPRIMVIYLTGFKRKLFRLVMNTKTVFNPFNGKMYTIESRSRVTNALVNHEINIHGAQAKEMGAFYFLFYGVIWLSIKSGFSWANNPLEREAIDNEHNPEYHLTREPFAWKKYRG